MNFHRCSICNKTNNEEVETEVGDYTTMPFVPDPDDPKFDICMECYEVVRETLWEFGDYPERIDYDDVQTEDDSGDEVTEPPD